MCCMMKDLNFCLFVQQKGGQEMIWSQSEHIHVGSGDLVTDNFSI